MNRPVGVAAAFEAYKTGEASPAPTSVSSFMTLTPSDVNVNSRPALKTLDADDEFDFAPSAERVKKTKSNTDVGSVDIDEMFSQVLTAPNTSSTPRTVLSSSYTDDAFDAVSPSPIKQKVSRPGMGISMRDARAQAQQIGFSRFWKLPKSVLVPYLESYKKTGVIPTAVKPRKSSGSTCDTGSDCKSNRCLEDVCVTSKQWNRRMRSSNRNAAKRDSPVITSTPSPTPSPSPVRTPKLIPNAKKQSRNSRKRSATNKQTKNNANKVFRNGDFVCEMKCRPVSVSDGVKSKKRPNKSAKSQKRKTSTKKQSARR